MSTRANESQWYAVQTRSRHESEEASAHPYLRAGERVRVTRGPFEGARGYLVRVDSGRPRLVIAIDGVNQALSVEIDARCVERDDA